MLQLQRGHCHLVVLMMLLSTGISTAQTADALYQRIRNGYSIADPDQADREVQAIAKAIQSTSLDKRDRSKLQSRLATLQKKILLKQVQTAPTGNVAQAHQLLSRLIADPSANDLGTLRLLAMKLPFDKKITEAYIDIMNNHSHNRTDRPWIMLIDNYQQQLDQQDAEYARQLAAFALAHRDRFQADRQQMAVAAAVNASARLLTVKPDDTAARQLLLDTLQNEFKRRQSLTEKALAANSTRLQIKRTGVKTDIFDQRSPAQPLTAAEEKQLARWRVKTTGQNNWTYQKTMPATATGYDEVWEMETRTIQGDRNIIVIHGPTQNLYVKRIWDPDQQKWVGPPLWSELRTWYLANVTERAEEQLNFQRKAEALQQAYQQAEAQTRLAEQMLIKHIQNKQATGKITELYKDFDRAADRQLDRANFRYIATARYNSQMAQAKLDEFIQKYQQVAGQPGPMTQAIAAGRQAAEASKALTSTVKTNEPDPSTEQTANRRQSERTSAPRPEHTSRPEPHRPTVAPTAEHLSQPPHSSQTLSETERDPLQRKLTSLQRQSDRIGKRIDYYRNRMQSASSPTTRKRYKALVERYEKQTSELNRQITELQKQLKP